MIRAKRIDNMIKMVEWRHKQEAHSYGYGRYLRFTGGRRASVIEILAPVGWRMRYLRDLDLGHKRPTVFSRDTLVLVWS
jgi:hypothetical protein